MPKIEKLALNSGIQTNQILTNDDEVCIPRLSCILFAVTSIKIWRLCKKIIGLPAIYVQGEGFAQFLPKSKKKCQPTPLPLGSDGRGVGKGGCLGRNHQLKDVFGANPQCHEL